MTTPVVDMQGIVKVYGTNHVLRGIDVSVRRHQVVVLIGTSGSGKSALLKTATCSKASTTARSSSPVRTSAARW